MSNTNHYVPILKWKGAEKGALLSLKDESKKNITPLIQLLVKLKQGDGPEEAIVRFEEDLPNIPEEIIKNWGTDPIFVDFSLLLNADIRAKSIESVISEGEKSGGFFIPAVYLSDDEKVISTAIVLAKKTDKGLCLRIACSDLENIEKLNSKINKVIFENRINHSKIDILVDIKETGLDESKYFRYLELSQKIDSLSKWRTFIFSSGSFPENLTGCKIDEDNLISRIDWKCWEKLSDKELKRKPVYSDYAIQHPIYQEKSMFFHPTASIRYTLEDEWWVLKGQKKRFDHYLASAASLVKDVRFFKEDFSEGDKYISEKAEYFLEYVKDKKTGGTGNPSTWIRAGINHHLEVVVAQISSLS